MSIEFSAVHNLVRTYQRVLKLPHAESSPAAGVGAEQDRLSISPEAREQEEINRAAGIQVKPLDRHLTRKDQAP